MKAFWQSIPAEFRTAPKKTKPVPPPPPPPPDPDPTPSPSIKQNPIVLPPMERAPVNTIPRVLLY